MEKRDAYLRTQRQIDRVRRIYSEIGQPLAANIITELYRHLETVQREAVPQMKKHTRARAKQA